MDNMIAIARRPCYARSVKRLLVTSILLLSAAFATAQSSVSGGGNKTDTAGATYVSTPDRTTAVSLTSTSCPGTGCASITVEGRTGISFILTGSWSATVVFEGSIDGTNFISLSAFDDTNDKWVASTTTTGSFWVEPLGGMNTFRTRVSAYTSGTVTGTLLASTALNMNLESMAAAGSPVPPLLAAIGVSDGTNIQNLRVDTAGSLFVTSQNLKSTYSVTTLVTPGAAATDTFGVCGSASKTIRITYFTLSGTATAASAMYVQLLKRSTADTSGTTQAVTIVPNDSANAAATATATAYTANPTAGNSVGVVRNVTTTLTTAAGAIPASLYALPFGVENDQEIVLRGTAQCLYANQNGVTPTGESVAMTFQWTEE